MFPLKYCPSMVQIRALCAALTIAAMALAGSAGSHWS
jgi:hypothetical protein